MTQPDGPTNGRVDYGDDPSQYAELTLPGGDPRGVVVVIHGGFWKAEYDASLGRPLAASLAEQGWAAWNLEYRRVGNGGGAPATFDDIAAGIDKLTDLGLDLSTVVTLGHSAGGHLAVWAAALPGVTAAISQAGVIDLQAAYDQGLGGGAVEAFLGHPPGPPDERYDPISQVPLDVPVWCVHGTDRRHRADLPVPVLRGGRDRLRRPGRAGRGRGRPLRGDRPDVAGLGADAGDPGRARLRAAQPSGRLPTTSTLRVYGASMSPWTACRTSV